MLRKHSRRRSKRESDPMLRSLLVRNVRYAEGVDRKVVDIEQVYKFRLPTPYLNNTLSSGSLASSASLDPVSRLDSFAKWAACFRQYLVLSITAVSSISASGIAQGHFWMQIQEANSVPTGAMVSEEKAVVSLNALNDTNKNSCTIVWKPKSSEDLVWTDCGTPLNLAYFKVYGNTTNTLTSVSDSTSKVSTMFIYEIAFRYLV